MKLLIVSALTIGSFMMASATTAMARSLTRNMTCEQTRQYSERHGRVWVVANGKDVIPLYGYVDRCASISIQSPLYVRTLDQAKCLIGYRCYED